MGKKLTKIYIKLMTQSSVFFLSYLLVGILLCLFLTITTRIDIIKTYSAIIESSGPGNINLVFKESIHFNDNRLYLYTDKKKQIYHVKAEISTNKIAKIVHIKYIDEDNKNSFITQNIGKEVTADIPQGNTTLFKRIFLKGGKL